jgi:hypothetical protein
MDTEKSTMIENILLSKIPTKFLETRDNSPVVEHLPNLRKVLILGK